MLQKINTKAVGFAGIGLLVLTAAADAGIRGAISSCVERPSPENVSAAVGIVAAFVLAYYGMPHSVPAQAAVTATVDQK